MSFFRWLTSEKVLIKVVVLFLLLLLTLFSYLFGLELISNQNSFLESIRQERRHYVEQLADQIHQMAHDGAPGEALVEYLKTDIQVSGSRWVFLSIGNTVVFAKNQSTTESLGALSYWYRFHDHILEQPDALMEYTSFDHGYKTYRVGLVSSRYAAISEGNVPRHNLFLILATGSTFMLLVSLFLGTAVTLNRIRKKHHTLQQELVEKNKQIQALLAKAILLQEEACEPEEEEYQSVVYDAELIRSFLRKSDDPGLRPICLLGICFIMGRKYYSKDEIFSYIDPVKDLLSPRHLLAEAARGKFVAILYRTDFQEAEELRLRIKAVWDHKPAVEGLQVGMGIIKIDEAKETAEEAYDRFLFELSKACGSGTLIRKQGDS